LLDLPARIYRLCVQFSKVILFLRFKRFKSFCNRSALYATEINTLHGRDGMAFRQSGTGRSAARFRPLAAKTRTFVFDLDLS
jgi:hypothetical protein